MITNQIEMDIQEPFIIQPITKNKDDPVYTAFIDTMKMNESNEI